MPNTARPRVLLAGLAAAALGLSLAVPARAELAPTDQRFLRDDAQGSSYELAIAQLAVQRAARPEVRAYAGMVVNDHEAYNAALRMLAQAKGVSLPSGLSATNRASLDRLSRLRGAAFDAAFIREAQRINRQDVTDAKQEGDRTTDADMKSFVEKFAPVDAKHAADAEALSHRQVASRMPVIAPPPTGGTMPVITPPSTGTMPIIPPPAPNAK